MPYIITHHIDVDRAAPIPCFYAPALGLYSSQQGFPAMLSQGTRTDQDMTINPAYRAFRDWRKVLPLGSF